MLPTLALTALMACPFLADMATAEPAVVSILADAKPNRDDQTFLNVDNVPELADPRMACYRAVDAM